MELIGFDAHKYVQADRSVERCDTIIDIKSGYFELFDTAIETKLCQVAKFNNGDSTILVGISGYYADEQCSNHPFHFFEIAKSLDTFISLNPETILPTLDVTLFFTDAKPIQILEKYLPAIKKAYLGPNATIENLLEEVYDFHIILPKKRTTAKVTLTICDYILRNEVSIDHDDWRIIEEHIKIVEFHYDKIKKQFKPTKHEQRK